MGFDLSGMSRSELEDLVANAQKQMRKLADSERKAALKAARQVAQDHGFELEELLADAGATPAKGRSAKPKNPPKYRNPADPEQTWSGRGRKPQWVLAFEQSGRPLDDCAISNVRGRRLSGAGPAIRA
jgi:DNA-binding protein H-NS